MHKLCALSHRKVKILRFKESIIVPSVVKFIVFQRCFGWLEIAVMHVLTLIGVYLPFVWCSSDWISFVLFGKMANRHPQRFPMTVEVHKCNSPSPLTYMYLHSHSL